MTLSHSYYLVKNMKYSFENDYSEGTHPKILEALVKTNLEQTVGYGLDDYCLQATNALKKKVNNNNIDVHFLPNGTGTNALVIDTILKRYQAVIACDSGHINVHETGAVESTGHKVLTRPHINGKLNVKMIESILNEHPDEHMVMPSMVYISQPTEYGTVYSLEELKDIYNYCKQHNLYLYIDGARLASALCVEGAPSLKDLVNYSDVFYIGGTKNGALMGECLVIVNDELKNDFRYQIKNHGLMMAKGRILGIQFLELFKDNLYEEIGKHQTDMAQYMAKQLRELNVQFYLESPTNQLFIILSNELIEKLHQDYNFMIFQPIDDNNSCARLVTSFNTQKSDVDGFISTFKKYM
ncbi:MAG: aminotransferase class I/II-fold pyridoxal phosphate-dependent enzyme [Thomasclavelia sp.]|jgi:threonine aldolase|nr:aminotransferase class I/II-fold pyridoxal phosphate-dependent enzyme [Thomasclavelia sp.]